MPAHDSRIPELRPLSEQERALLRWMVEQSSDVGSDLLAQLDRATVATRCSCGCASIDLAVDRAEEDKKEPMELIGDYAWRTKAGNLCGAYLFTRRGHLAGLDLWSIDGAETPSTLPEIQALFPLADLQKADPVGTDNS
ncbi:MAG: hypothetical protein R3F03_15040 [Opitutaceae bacterium]